MALSLFIAACGRHAVTMSTADSVPSDSVDVSDKAAAESMNAEEVPLARRSPDATGYIVLTYLIVKFLFSSYLMILFNVSFSKI